jgi:hypothetical protein
VCKAKRAGASDAVRRAGDNADAAFEIPVHGGFSHHEIFTSG